MFKRKAEEEPAGKAARFAGGADSDRKATFAAHLAALNTQFASWVAEQAQSAPKELWTDGVEDYLKYAKQLLAEFKDVLEGGAGKPEAAGAGGPSGSGKADGAAVAAAPAGASKPPLAPSGGLFGSGSAAAPGSIFGGLQPAGGGGSGGSGGGGAFGLGGSAAAPAFGGFGGSGAGSAANSGGSGLFNVPSTGTLGSSFNTGAATGADEDGEEGEEQQNAEPSVQLEAGEGTEMLAKQRVKLMSMTSDRKWKDKGTGTLTLRRATAGEAAGKQPYFVFTTDSGRVLINAPLVKGGPKPMTNPKAPASVIMFLISSVDGNEERATHMFRCESPDAAKQLLKTIEEHA